MSITPYKESDASKKEQVADMFDSIAHKYDFLNHFFSLGIDVLWRKKAIRMLKELKTDHILDIATGTGDFAFESLSLNPKKVVGVDISAGMLDIGKQKIQKRGKQDIMEFKLGDSEALDFEDNTFDIVTVSFGVRNFENLKKGLADMLRVLKPGGTVAIIEFSQPEKFPIKQLYGFYFRNIMPLIGKLVSKDSSAYTYLPESVQAFPYGDEFTGILTELGYKEAKTHLLTGGIASIYLAKA
jgi:demethylmenaquinone methyltransferase/2-methoxy-6-polyprenyl-1,4-benzoquinol methylase